jgi:ElaB/YqjD/DUF883 family membrane-anchored ribosome-binding protein
MKNSAIAFAILISIFCSTNSTARDLPDRLKSCDLNELRNAADEVVAQSSKYDAIQLFAASYAYFRLGEKDKAVFWFFAGQLRLRQAAIASPSENIGFITNMFVAAGLPITNYAEHDIMKLASTIDGVLEWEAATPPDRRTTERDGYEQALKQARDSLIEFKNKRIANKTDIEREAKDSENEAERIFRSWSCKR